MRKFFFLACASLSLVLASAQSSDTVRKNVDYRTGNKADDSEESSRPSNQYFALQANQLLRQLFNLSNTTTNTGNPFSITYSFNNKATGSGLAFGLGYATSHTEDKDQSNDRKTDNSNINFRFGYDKKAQIAKRWTAGWGFDLLLSHSKSFTQSNQNGFQTEIQNKSNGWGFGPRATILFTLNSKILLGTESSWYFQKVKTDSEISFSGGSPQQSEQKNTTFALQVPVAIFLTMKF